MSSKFRRFEILLPIKFNDGRNIPSESIGIAFKEIVTKFGAASYEPESVEGHWIHEDTIYIDALSKIVVDIPDTDQNRQWMRDFKSRWKASLGQLELWLISFEIEID
jgi:hypothetical protein